MTISSTTNRVSYSGNGVTTAFSFPYKFLEDADLVVIQRVTATGVETIKTLTTHYTVAGEGEPSGGTVTMLVAPPTGTKLTIYRDPAAIQGLDLVENDPLPAESVEESFDLMTMILQRLKDLAGRAVRLSEGYTATFDTTLPTTLTADCVVKVNAAGDGFEIGPTASEISGAEASAIAAAASAAAAAASAAAALVSENNAETAETNAETAEANAETAEANAETAEANAEAAQAAAEAAQAAAEAAQAAAEAAQAAAETAETNAETAETNAETAETNAETAETNAEAAQAAAEAAQEAAEDAAVLADASADAAAASALSMNPALVATQDIASGGTITVNGNYVQNRKVQGNGGAQTTSTTPFGTGTAVDGITMRLIGMSDTNILTVPYSDTNHGCMLNGDAALSKDDTLTLLFDLTALRWYELSRNF